MVWVLVELLAHGVYWDLHQQDEKEKLRERKFATVVGIDNLDRLWLETLEVLFEI
jgi:hypothetical protein